MNISLSLDRARTSRSPLLPLVHLSQVAHFHFRAHTRLRHRRRQRSPTAHNWRERKHHADLEAMVIMMILVPICCLFLFL